jgi:hypothetical protein
MDADQVMAERTLLTGVAFSGYRSFTNGLQVLAPLRKINVVAGRNAGKSNVLRFLHVVVLRRQYDTNTSPRRLTIAGDWQGPGHACRSGWA